MIDGALRLSASDLMRFKGCAHAIALDLRMLERADLTPDDDSEEAELLQRQGDDHELAFLESLKSQGRSIIEIPKDGITLEESVNLTREALMKGPDIVFQGAFLGGAWGGYSDFLERVDRPSKLGNYAYEVVDTKLKRSPHPKHILQLALYSDLLEDIQGVAPEHAHLQLGDGSRFSAPLAEFSAYARLSRGKLEAFVADRPGTRSEPVATCGLCRWRSTCKQEWDQADSLSLVAGITRSQRAKLESAGVGTMAALGVYAGRAPNLSTTTQARLSIQARLQTDRRAGGPPSFVLRTPEHGKGFGLLPEPDEGDLFYDIEGDPYFPEGLEYLHGFWLKSDGQWMFKAFWAHDREAEGQATAALLSFLVEHLAAHPKAHIYHYAHYELTALRRLTARHRVGEAAMDQLQRELRFVDLFRVVSGGLIASEAGYSIKDLEAFYMEKRAGDVATAGASVVVYERWRESQDPALLEQIRAYNETDCRSTQLLRDWLIEKVRPQDLVWRQPGPAPEAGPLANVAEEEAEMAALRARLEPVFERYGPDIGALLLDLGGFHAREDKPTWWAIFDRLSRESDDLLDDLDCLAGLEATGPAVPDKRSFQRTYAYPAQETKLRATKRPCAKPAEKPIGVEISGMDATRRTVILRSTAKNFVLPDRLDLIPPMPIKNTTLRDAIVAVREGFINAAPVRAVEDLLLRLPPRFTNGDRPYGIIDPSQPLPEETSRAILAMDDTTLAIQGPPGTGKTYVSALAIVDLVRSGRRVAVSSNSHKAISNLLEAVAVRARATGTPCRIVQKTSDETENAGASDIVTVTDNNAPELMAAQVVGATAWHFARYDTAAFSHLFVDEAGQVSLANLIAMARSSDNLVLVGDPMQLAQPLQGLHPGLSAQSCLEYLMDGHRVVPPERGVFMPVSRRMHPDVCDFISRAVYESRLQSDEGAAAQRLTDASGESLVGARFMPVAHEGRSQVCPEEIDAVLNAVHSLTGTVFHDRDGVQRPIGHGDILVVAPYNAQVNALRERLPQAIRVGTVDRFQGQEAPICLISMTTSSAEELPRDIEFLFSLNRINVAISRAQVTALMFASPALLEVPCRTTREMSLVNTLCMLAEW
ncbi:TM0106 family RecB-like putative nuclease [Brevundimonas sp.]|uniref:TM0106 family RecB-like putative nuclease n=1 Tax=Brevundimonas sp. TaxID=1871086 RepID=UPI003BAB9AB1